MAGTPTTVYEFPTLDGGDNNDSVAAVNALAAALDALLLPRTVTTAQRDALTGGRRPTGLIVNNSTTGRLERWNGTAWEALDVVASAAAAAAQSTADAALPKAGGTMTGAIAMGGAKVTGMGTGTAAGDAVTKAQLDGVQARVAHGGANTVGGVFNVTITPPAGTTLQRVVCSVNGASVYFLAGNGYQQVVVGAEIQNAVTGSTNINRHGVGSGADTTALTIYVDYIAYFA